MSQSYTGRTPHNLNSSIKDNCAQQSAQFKTIDEVENQGEITSTTMQRGF